MITVKIETLQQISDSVAALVSMDEFEVETWEKLSAWLHMELEEKLSAEIEVALSAGKITQLRRSARMFGGWPCTIIYKISGKE